MIRQSHVCVVLLWLGSGCGLLLDLDAEGEAPADAEADATSGRVDASATDARGTDAGAADAGLADTGTDAGMSLDPCDPGWLGEGVIAAYDFDYNFRESIGAGAPDAYPAPEPDAMPWWPAPCGATALGFDGRSYAIIPHWDRWQEVRSVDFWLIAPTMTTAGRPRGILSRDANTHGDGGHLTVARSNSNRITVRVQPDRSRPEEEKRCSPPYDLTRWVHVGVNVGSPSLELWIDGVLVDEVGVDEVSENLATLGCSDDVEIHPTEPIDLCCTSAPWVLGGSNVESTEGTVDLLRDLLPDGAMDRLRFSTERRDFSAAAR